jgi:aminoglycoside 3-N-acetyltransferase
MTTQISPLSRHDIASGFRALGVSRGDVLLLHSSLRSFGPVSGGAETVIDGILDAVGDTGTLLVPTLTGHENLWPESPPHVDLRSAPCWVGRIPETLRQRPEAVRSVHPTHSCAALGARAGELTRGHHLSPTPCGVTSPYFRVAAAAGYIAMAGCDLSACTTFHTVEELANVDYHLQPTIAYGTCIDPEGNRIDTPCRLHSYAGPPRDFPVMEPIMAERGLLRIGPVGASTVRLIDAMGLIESTLDKLRFDPWYITAWRGQRRPQC